MLTLEDQSAVNLVGEDHDIAVSDDARQSLDILYRSMPPVGFCGELR